MVSSYIPCKCSQCHPSFTCKSWKNSHIRVNKNLENRPFLQNQGKPGIVKEFLYFSLKSGKNYLVSLAFSLTTGMVVRKVVALIIVSKCELHHLALRNSNYICSTYLLSFICFTSFCKHVK